MKGTVKTGEEGFILVFTLLILVVVTLLGVSSIDTSIFESAMSANDALYKQAFYQADGGANVAGVIIEENISCPTGFSPMPAYGNGALMNKSVLIESTSLSLWANTPTAVQPADANRDAYFFYDKKADPTGTLLPHTNITVGGVTGNAPGYALQAAAGSEGRGKSAATGTQIVYDVFSQHIGNRQNESIVEIEWWHVNGSEGNCKY